MHTIPQNVTSYEDKIVGIFVGRQFIYLAVGGLTAFIILSTGGGAALPIRFIMAIAVMGLAAALALVKVNDRGFDVWLWGYLKAVLGPTEWAWQKEIRPMSTLVAPDQTAPATTAAVKKPTGAQAVSFNLQRKDAYKSYVSGSSNLLDRDERQFLDNLNFSEPMPVGSKIVPTVQKAPPPMLTPDNPLPVAEMSPKPVIVPETPAVKPLAALAASSDAPAFSYTLQGQPSVSIQPQRTNRSLSRQLLSGAALPVPVHGELRLNLDPAYQQELTNLIGFAPANPGAAAISVEPSTPMTSIPNSAQTPEPIMMASSDDLSAPLPGPTQPNDASMDNKLQAAMDFHQSANGQRQSLNIQSSGPITPPAPVPTEPEPVQPASQPGPEADDVDTIAQQAAKDIEQQLATSEPSPERTSTTLDSHYQAELGRVQQRGLDASTEAQKAQADLDALQQQSQLQPGQVSQTDLEQQKSLVAKLQEEERRSAAFARELLDKMEQAIAAGQNSPAAPVTEASWPSIPAPVTAPPPPPAPAQAAPVIPPPANLPILTSQANVINGFVFDATNQFVDGAVVVIKDESGEAKRALKTNKLGQFLVTTPLANGHYTVEVDLKGAPLGTMTVELIGSVVPPVTIRTQG